MMSKKRLFTSESVTEGHPDKICDQISDSVLDAFLAKDPNARVACEVICSNWSWYWLSGEITSVRLCGYSSVSFVKQLRKLVTHVRNMVLTPKLVRF